MKEIKRKLALVLAVCMVLNMVITANGEEVAVPEETAAQQEMLAEDVPVIESKEVEREASDPIEEDDIEEASPDKATYEEADTEDVTEASPSDAVRTWSTVVDGITITLTADSGVFPEDAELWAEKVEDEATEEAIEEAIEKERDNNANVALSVKFDIMMLVNGEEIQPDTSKGSVKVSFTLEEKISDCLDANAYHLKEDAKGELTAKNLYAKVKTEEAVSDGEAEEYSDAVDIDSDEEFEDGIVFNDVNTNENGNSNADSDTKINESIEEVTVIEADTDSFSYYVVEFTYNKLQYVLPGNTSIKLSKILNALAIEGTVSEAEVSNEEFFTVKIDAEGDDWTVTALHPFNTVEWMKVTVDDSQVYKIEVTDSQGNVAKIGETEYSSVQAAIDAAEKNQTVQMIDNSTENITVIDSKTVTLDLNGHVLSSTSGRTVTVNGDLTIVDSSPLNAHYYTVGSDGLWTLNNTATEGTPIDDLDARPVSGAVIKVSGGCISGGGININTSGKVILNGGNIVANKRSGDGDGGGLTVSGTCTMTGGYIAGNYTDAYGGGISVSNSGTFTANNVNIVFNRTVRQGGGISANGKFHLTEGSINYNLAGEDGGAIHTWSNAKEVKSLIDGTIISNNTCHGNGGAIHHCKGDKGHELTIIDSTITGNTSSGNGGGIDMEYMLILGGTTKIKKNTPDNLYIPRDKTFSVCSDTEAPADGMDIYVSSQKEPSEGNPVVISDIGSAPDAVQYFHADNYNYRVLADGTSLQIGLNNYNYKWSFHNIPDGKRSIGLSTVLDSLDITGTVTYATVSNAECFTVDNVSGVWTVEAHKTFDTQEWMKITAGGKEYEILVTDVISVSSWEELKSTINSAAPGMVIILQSDITCDNPQGDNNYIRIVSGKDIILDLNGHVLNRGLSEAIENGHVIKIEGKLKVIDSSLSSAHYFTVGENGLWTLNSEATDGTSIDSLTSRPGISDVIKVSGGCITGGSSSMGGGGVYVAEGATFNLESGNIVGNYDSGYTTPYYYGGGVLTLGTFNMNDGAVIGNYVENYFASGDGDGGGVGIYHPGIFIMTGGSISFNRASTEGGGIAANGRLEIRSGTVSYNSAVRGGGIHTYQCGNSIIKDAIITGNTATEKGGAIYTRNRFEEHSLTLNGNDVISGNSAVDGGGGIYNESIAIIGGNTEIRDNSANDGGGIYNVRNINISGNSNIRVNSAAQRGGGLYNSGSAVINGDTEITVNSAKDGAGIYNAKNVTISGNTQITGNSADISGIGGGVYFNGDTCILDDAVKIKNNTCGGEPSNLWLTEGRKFSLVSKDHTGMEIYIGSDAVPTVETPVIVCDSVSESDKIHFFSDNIDYYIYTFGGRLFLRADGLSYTINGETSIKLSDILEQLGRSDLLDSVTKATVSDSKYLTINKDDGENDWTLSVKRHFTKQEWLKITAEGHDYTILLIDANTVVVYYYWDEESKSMKEAERPISEVTIIAGDAPAYEFEDGKWYAVDGTVTIDTRITRSGTTGDPVHLIIKDGSSLIASKGISNSEGKALYIYGQEDGTGVLNIPSAASGCSGIGGDRNASGGTITIHGSNITAHGDNMSAGIGGGISGYSGNITINAGVVTTYGDEAGIGAGYSGRVDNITINGGIVNAYGGRECQGIGAALEYRQGTVTINGGTVTACGGEKEGHEGSKPGKAIGGVGNLYIANKLICFATESNADMPDAIILDNPGDNIKNYRYAKILSDIPEDLYKVEHYLQKADTSGEYEYKETTICSRISSSGKTDPIANSYTGFSAQDPLPAEDIRYDKGTVVKLHYTRNPYTVTFNGNYPGTTYAATLSEIYGLKYVLPTPDPTRRGYNFEGWYTEAEGGTLITTSTDVTITAAQMLYAHWTANSYVVKFDSNGGSGTMADEPMVYDVEKELTENAFTRTGYTFSGWTETVDGSKEYDDKAVVKNLAESGIKTLYAVWEAKTYTVTLDNQGATSAGTEQVTATYDAAMPSATMPVKTGYTFGGYFTAVNGGGIQYYKADGSSAHNWDVAENKTLYAKWTANAYTIIYKDKGGGIFSGIHESGYPLTHTYDTETSLKGASKAGYTFKGWFLNEDCTGDALTVLGAKDYTAAITLYAKWEANKYTVTFIGNYPDSTYIATISETYGLRYVLPSPDPTQSGYTFMGWYTAAAGGIRITTSTAVSISADHTIYAHWKKNSAPSPSGGGSSSVTITSIGWLEPVIGAKAISGEWTHAGNKWTFKSGGKSAINSWCNISYGTAEKPKNGWFFFDANGYMMTGWIKSVKGDWYYCREINDADVGRMETGWHIDMHDGKTYYLDPLTGKMAIGWTLINGKMYYFSEISYASPWRIDTDYHWTTISSAGRAIGSMYANEITPDGHRVDTTGARIQ